MNSAYFQAVGGGSLHLNLCSVTALLAMSSGKITRRGFYDRGLRTGLLILPQYMAISRHSCATGLPSNIREWLTSLPPVSPVSLSLLLEKAGLNPTPAINGRKREIALASYDRDSRCWRTSQASLLNPISEPFSGSWPKSGTMRDGKIYRRPRWEPSISGTGCGFWPTPTASNGTGPCKHGDGGADLQTAVKYPTPTNSMMTMGDMEQARFSGNGGKRPSYREAQNFPTPSSREWKGGRAFDTLKAKGRTENNTLNDKVNALEGKSVQLSAFWVEWLMHWPLGWSNLTPITKLVWLDPSEDPHPRIPRVASGQKNRTNRLKAIGNGQYPDCVAAMFLVLAGEVETVAEYNQMEAS